MTVAFGLLAAVAYGVADFFGGVASRREKPIAVLLYGYPTGAVVMLFFLPFFSGPLSWTTVLFGVAGGTCGMTGVILLYWLMSIAPLNVVSPVTAVLAAIVPVFFGVGLGERPSIAAWLGIALGVVAVALISQTPEDHPHGPISASVLGLSLLSGVGFAGYFIFLAQAPDDSGAWPLVVSRWTAALLIVPIAFARGERAVLRGQLLAFVLICGVCDASANLFFLIASREGYLSLASVLTALYPAFTVALAIGVLHEHTGRLQWIGFGFAAASVALIAS